MPFIALIEDSEFVFLTVPSGWSRSRFLILGLAGRSS